MLGWLGKVRRPSRVLHDRATTQPELASVTILVRRPQSTGHILQKGGIPDAQHHEEFRPELAYVPRPGNRRVRWPRRQDSCESENQTSSIRRTVLLPS